jgi:hypothetical protein
MEVDHVTPDAIGSCPECARRGRNVERITVEAMLRPAALALVADPEHRFCPTPECQVVYFGRRDRFHRDEVAVPVFQKEPTGGRMACYCFAVGEDEIRQQLAAGGSSSVVERITALVRAGRCACEVKNPQGSCCLGNLAAIARSAATALAPEWSSRSTVKTCAE